ATAVLQHPDARTDLRVATVAHLDRPIGIGEQRAPEPDQVGVARAAHVLGDRRRTEAPGDEHWDVDALSDRPRQATREALVEGGVLDVGAAYAGRHRDVFDRRRRLQGVDDAERVGELEASLGEILGADPDADGI